MARPSFYDSEEYRAKQAERTKRNQDKGVYEHLKKQVVRTCNRDSCTKSFMVQVASPKKYCSQSCATSSINTKRRWSDEVRKKISIANTGKKSIFKGTIRVARVSKECSNPYCKTVYFYERYMKREFCSRQCAIQTVGARPTSPKASRGKAGVRPDIDATTYFYSRWEANMARLYTYLGISWVFEPQTFDIGKQTYTPDFYLPDENTYIEVKNFWGEYSRIRDTKFRKRYPDLKLNVILKQEYQALEKQYAHLIPEWEYKNSPFG